MYRLMRTLIPMNVYVRGAEPLRCCVGIGLSSHSVLTLCRIECDTEILCSRLLRRYSVIVEVFNHLLQEIDSMLRMPLLSPSQEHDKANLLLLLKKLLSLRNCSLVVCFRSVWSKTQDMQLVALLLRLSVSTLVRVTRILRVLIYGAFSFST